MRGGLRRQGSAIPGYSLIYTAGSISSVIGPVVIGIIADSKGLDASIWVLSFIAFLPLLFSGVLAGKLKMSINLARKCIRRHKQSGPIPVREWLPLISCGGFNVAVHGSAGHDTMVVIDLTG